MQKGKLFLVGTPIGNLGDMSPRAVETLENVDFIAAEDTRVSIKLLNHFGIKKKMISCHEHNIHECGELIIKRLLAGQNCAVITDAGMPCISDPGEDLVKLCGQNGISTVVVPGPSALIAALAISGLTTGRFCFEGFLSVKKTGRFEHLKSIKNDRRTLIFYEAPHKVEATLKDMLSVFGNRKISIARELTKIHEEIIRTDLESASKLYRDVKPKGEFVLIIEGAEPEKEEATLEDAVQIALRLILDGETASHAARETSVITGFKKGDIYKEILLHRGKS